MKKGSASSRRLWGWPGQGGRSGRGWRAVLISLSPPRGVDKADGSSLRWRISLGTVRRPGEAVDVAGRGGEGVGAHPADPGDRQKQREETVVRPESAQRGFAVADFTVEPVDQAQAGLARSLPRLRQSQPAEQLAAAEAE